MIIGELERYHFTLMHCLVPISNERIKCCLFFPFETLQIFIPNLRLKSFTPRTKNIHNNQKRFSVACIFLDNMTIIWRTFIQNLLQRYPKAACPSHLDFQALEAKKTLNIHKEKRFSVVCIFWFVSNHLTFNRSC